MSRPMREGWYELRCSASGVMWFRRRLGDDYRDTAQLRWDGPAGSWSLYRNSREWTGTAESLGEAKEAAEDALVKQCEETLRALGRWPYRYRWTGYAAPADGQDLLDYDRPGQPAVGCVFASLDGWEWRCHAVVGRGGQGGCTNDRDAAVSWLIEAAGIDPRDVAPFPEDG